MINKKSLGNFFVVLAFSFMLLIYVSYMNSPHSNSNLGPQALVVFHTFFALLLWSFVHSSISEPGTVPPYWGFYMGDSENKRKRYCLLCHVFKPDRCHHCSICNRCVLNMDHHCRNIYSAWISNCIGFYNRKLFILMLIYSILSSYFVLPHFISLSYPILSSAISTRALSSSDSWTLLLTFLVLSFCVVITKFTWFHLKLISNNSTTIDTLENNQNFCYSISVYRNFMQVFGKNQWVWAFPWYGASGKPNGDGISWPVVENQVSDSEVYVESEAHKENSSVQLGTFTNPELWPAERRSDLRQGKSVSDSETDISMIRAQKSPIKT